MRTACRVTASLGQGMGGYMATIEFGPEPGHAELPREWLIHGALPRLIAHPQVVGAHLCEGDEAVSRILTAETRDRGSSDATVRWVLLVEGSETAAVAIACQEGLGVEVLRQHGGAAGWCGIYRLVYALGATDGAP